MRRDRIQRRFRLCKFTFRQLGRLRIGLVILVFAVALGFHYAIATHFVTQQPDDSKLYSQLAKNILEQGVFSVEALAPFNPTLIRLPGYPVFLAVVYAVFGVGNEMAVRIVQGLAYSLTCICVFLIAFNWLSGIRRRFKAGIFAFIFSAFCPFTAIYAATLLTETLAMLFLAATILVVTYAFKSKKTRRSLIWWFAAGLLGGLNVFLRPDAGLFVFGVGLTLAVSVFWGRGKSTVRIVDRLIKGIVFTAVFVLLLTPWAVRNEMLFGVFQPLAPSHAEMPGEFVPPGYYLWLRTWIDDSKYIGPMLWDLERKPIRVDDLPASAFASDDEKSRIATMLSQYNNSDPNHPFLIAQNNDAAADESGGDNSDSSNDEIDESGDSDDSATAIEAEWKLKIEPETDAGFERVARERITREPWRFYIGLPAKRAASMWFDTHSDYWPFAGELFPLKDIDEDTNQHIWLPLFAGLTWVYTFLTFAGITMLFVSKDRRALVWVILVLFISVPRIIFFGTLENPEPRYLVELFIPAAILCGLILASLRWRREPDTVGLELFYGN